MQPVDFLNSTGEAAMKMQVDEAASIKRAWGDKPCDHPDYATEYDRGASTGDYRCTQCGRLLTDQQVEEIKKREG